MAIKILLSDGSFAYWSSKNAPQGNWDGTDDMGVFRFFVNSADVSGSSMFDVWTDTALTIPFTINLHQVNWYAPMDAVIHNNNTPQDAASVTPSDTVPLAKAPTRGLFIGGAGNISVVTADGDNITLTGITAGTQLNLAVNQINATGTTATNIVALY